MKCQGCEGRCKARCSVVLKYEMMRKEPEAQPLLPWPGLGAAPAGRSPGHQSHSTGLLFSKNLLSLKCEESKSHFHLSGKSFAAETFVSPGSAFSKGENYSSC